ncbi:hypothetical protein Tco_1461439, partial [Tanacetum coccineum]
MVVVVCIILAEMRSKKKVEIRFENGRNEGVLHEWENGKNDDVIEKWEVVVYGFG